MTFIWPLSSAVCGCFRCQISIVYMHCQDLLQTFELYELFASSFVRRRPPLFSEIGHKGTCPVSYYCIFNLSPNFHSLCCRVVSVQLSFDSLTSSGHPYGTIDYGQRVISFIQWRTTCHIGGNLHTCFFALGRVKRIISSARTITCLRVQLITNLALDFTRPGVASCIQFWSTKYSTSHSEVHFTSTVCISDLTDTITSLLQLPFPAGRLENEADSLKTRDRCKVECDTNSVVDSGVG